MLLAKTYAVTEPLPTFPYWSWKDIVEVNVSPLWVTEPLKSIPSVKLPLESIKIAGLVELYDETVCEPADGEYVTLTCAVLPLPNPVESLNTALVNADSII